MTGRVDKRRLTDGPLSQTLRTTARARRKNLANLAGASRSDSPRNDLLPSLEYVERPPRSLIAPARNVRRIDSAHVQSVANAINACGFCDPVLVDKNYNILDGVTRVEAAKLLDLPYVPCIRVGHLNNAQKRLLRLALNRLSEKGTWNIEELSIELKELVIEGVAIESSGFSGEEIDQIIVGDDVTAIEQGPVEPEPDTPPCVQIGDIFILGEHRIICGDATEPETYRPLMGTDIAQLVLTDEPYNVPIAGNVTKGPHREFVMASGEMSPVEYANFNAAWIGASSDSLSDGGILGTFIDWRGYPVVDAAALKLSLHPLNLIVWCKSNGGMGSLYRSQHELLPLYKKGGQPHINNVQLGKNGRWRSNLWSYPGASSLSSDAREGLRFHPTVKPVKMLEDCLLDITKRGSVVLDPFLGSGSTLIAAQRTGRACRGIELDPLFVEVVLKRFEAATGISAIFAETGETYSSLIARRSSARGELPAL